MPGLKDIIKNAFSGLSGGFFSGAADIISKFVADPTAKAEALKELEIKHLEHEEKMAAIGLELEKVAVEERKNEEDNVSARWKSDMESDSWLSKNTRPIVMLSLLAFLFVIIIFDSAIKEGFDVKPAYINLMESLLITVVVAYFGSRGVEKFKSMHESTKVVASINKK